MKGGKRKMEKGKGVSIWGVIVICLVIAILVSVVTVNITGNVVKVATSRAGTEVYTKGEIDTKLNSLTTQVDAHQKGLEVLTSIDCARYFTTGEGNPTTFTLAGKSYKISLTYTTSAAAIFDVNGQVTSKLANGASYKLSSGALLKVKVIHYTGKDTDRSSVSAVIDDC